MTAKERKQIGKIAKDMLKALDSMDEILDRIEFAEDRKDLPAKKKVKVGWA